MSASTKQLHILRYGTVAEKAHLEKAISAYDCLAINGNTAAYVSSAIAKFIVEKFFSKQDKGFFIDPITYAFQNEIKLLYSKSKTTGDEHIKKSVAKLIEVYGAPVSKALNRVEVEPEDFSSYEANNGFCKRVLDFQYSLVFNEIQNKGLSKYFEYVAPNSLASMQLRPRFLIAPYFYLDSEKSDFDKWLQLNEQFVVMANALSEEYFEKCEVFAQIVINQNVLHSPAVIKKIADTYKGTNCAGYTIWVDNFNEQEASAPELCGFMELLRLLRGKPIYNMYGGYFSILLTHKKLGLLSGVSHGLEYGESRGVYPVGGGLPVSKYYFFPLHQRLDFTKAFYLLSSTGVIDVNLENWGSSKQYYETICKCGQCKKVIGSEMINFVNFESKEYYEVHRGPQVLRRKKASSDTKENCLYHYLLSKKKEFREVSKRDINDLLADLSGQQYKYSHCEALQTNELDYLEIWKYAIERSMRG